ncbi:hypothetical protein Ciccas_008961, partial [Cichlidogyrus casuarinus]
SIRVLGSVLTNSLWLGVTLTNVFEQSIVAAFIIYAPKYIETVFRLSGGLGSVVTGAVVVPSAVLGVLTGAFAMRRIRPNVPDTIRYLHVPIFLSVCTNIALLCLGCSDSNQIAGLTATYHGKPWPWSIFPTNLIPADLKSPCNKHLYDQCVQRFEPVCWQSRSPEDQSPRQLTFFSSCYAGCSGKQDYLAGTDSLRINYTECSCVDMQDLRPFGNGTGSVVSGECPTDQCSANFYAFIVLVFLHILLTALPANPSNVITLSSVRNEFSSQALALQLFFIRTLAFVPAPIYFGQLLDSVCQHREKLVPDVPDMEDRKAVCAANVNLLGALTGNETSNADLQISVKGLILGACKVYYSAGLPIVWLGGLLCLKLASLFSLMLTYKVARSRALEEEANAEQDVEASGDDQLEVKQ